VPIPRALVDILSDARARASEHGHADPNHYICPSRYEYQAGRRGIRQETVRPDKPMGQSTPEKALHRLARKAGIPDPDHVCPHDLRRAYAAIFLAANPGDIYRLQAILGHADISTTRIYLGDVHTLQARDAVDRVPFAALGGGTTNPHQPQEPESPAPGAKRADNGVRTRVRSQQARSGDSPQTPAPEDPAAPEAT
jgi:integrase